MGGTFLNLFNRSGSGRKRRIGREPHKRLLPRRLELEPLEDRAMLSAIQWTNRGAAGNDSDGFNGVFGVNADTARKVVDYALESWQNIITSFNYSDPKLKDTFSMNVSMLGSGTSLGANAGPTKQLGGKPTHGSATIGRGNDTNGDGLGDGAGWFLDATPQEHSEFFGTITNAFSGQAQAGSPAAGLSDLYSTLLHEFGHALGFTGGVDYLLLKSGLMTNTGQTDTVSRTGPMGQPCVTTPSQVTANTPLCVGTYWRFDGPSIRHLMTSFDSGGASGSPADSGFGHHSARAGATYTNPANGVVYAGAIDVMNSGIAFGSRVLIPETMVLVLQDAYGYTINHPANWPDLRPTNSGIGAYGTQFYAALDRTTGQLLIRGGPGNDDIFITSNGKNLTVSVDIGTDVAGTGSLPGAGNLPPFRTVFPTLYPITRIVVQSGGGNDNITIDALPRPLTLDGGAGDDWIVFGSPQNPDLNTFRSGARIQGGGGNDSLTFNDSNNRQRNRSYTLSRSGSFVNGPEGGKFRLDSQKLEFAYDAIDNLYVNAGSGTSATMNVPSHGTGVSTVINGAAIVNVGGGNVVQKLDGSLSIANLFRTTDLTIDDSAFASSAGIDVTHDSVQVTHAPFSFNIYFGLARLSSLTVNGGSGGNMFAVHKTRTPDFTGSVVLNTGVGTDDVYLYRSEAPVTVNGQAGRDTVNVGLNGSVQAIRAPFNVTNSGGYSALNVNDSAGTDSRTVTFYKSQGYDVITGLMPAGEILLKAADLSSLTIYAGGGSNVFDIYSTPRSNVPGGLTTTIHTGVGSDSVAVSATSGDLVLNLQGGRNDVTLGATRLVSVGLDQLQGVVHVSGPGGFNTLSVLDDVSTTSHVYILDRDVVQRTDKAAIFYEDITTLNLVAGRTDDTITIRDTMPANVFGGGSHVATRGGNDFIGITRTTTPLNLDATNATVVEVGSVANTLDDIQGGITLTASSGHDAIHLRLSDQASTADLQLDIFKGFIAGPRFQRSGAALIYANHLGNVTWLGGSGSDTVNVRTRPAALGARFELGAGDDVIDVGTDADVLEADLFAVGGEGTDRLVIRDQGTSTARHYTLGVDLTAGHASQGAFTARPVSNTVNAQIVSFDLIEAVTVNAGSGNNFFKITGSPSDASMLINAGVGDDTIDVGSLEISQCDANSCVEIRPNDSLIDIRGPLTIDGQGGNDSLILRDNGDSAARDYALAPTSLERSDAPASPIHFSDVEQQVIHGSAGDNSFTLMNTEFAHQVSLDGGDGMNTLDYSRTSAQPLPASVSWYQAEGDFSDASGGNHGTPHNGVTFAPGQLGQGFSFDGVDDYVDFGNDSSLDLTGSFTVSAWVNYQTPITGYKYLVADFDAGGTISQGSLGITEDHLFWYQSMTDGGHVEPVGTTSLVPGEWYHLAVVRDDIAKRVTLYVNGVQDGGETYTGTVVALQSTKVLGTSVPVSFPSDVFEGRIDEVSVFGEALSPGQIQTLVASPGGPGGPAQTQGIIVNLVLGAATGLTGGIANIHHVIGSTGNDILVGNGGHVLTGGFGRDLLIAGTFASDLSGGPGEDILIGGTTAYDVNLAALIAILDEWSQGGDFVTRVADLRDGSDGMPVLDADSVFSNGGDNSLMGGQAELDLFFGDLDLDEHDRQQEEEFDQV